MLRTLLLVLTALATLFPAQAFEHVIAYDKSNLSIENIAVADSNYSVLSYKGLQNGGELNHASLPIEQISISVPYNATNILLTSVGTFSEEIVTEYPLMCNRDDVSGVKAPGLILPPLKIANVADIAYIGYAYGAHKIVTINVHPVIEKKEANKADFCSSVTLNLTWTLSDDLSGEPYKCITGPMMTKGLSHTKSMVINPDDVVSNSPCLIQPLDVDEDDSGLVDYMIIAPDEFCDALLELAQIRRVKGYRTQVVRLSTILNSEIYEGDDTDPNNIIRDDAGKIRKYIQSVYENAGVRNVLLAGKYPKMPIRYAHSGYSWKNVPTDLYFSDLNTIWERRNDSIFYAKSSKFDFISEVNVGRIPFETVDEIDAYIDKLKIYEFNPGNGDASYLANMMLTRQNDYAMNKYFAEVEISNLYDAFNNNVCEMYNPTGMDVVDQLNIKPAGCWNFIGHGNPEGVSTYQNSLGSGGVLALDSQTLFMKKPYSKGLDKITNKYFPSWQFSMSCTLMPFDIFVDNGTTYAVTKNFGESYLLGEDYGGVAMIGNTRPILCSDGAIRINNFFPNIKKYYSESQHINPITAGFMISEARTYQGTRMSISGNLVVNLFGDPIVPLYISEPYKLKCSVNAVSSKRDWAYVVTGQTPDSLFLADMDLNLKYTAHRKRIKQSELGAIDIIPNCVQCVYGKNTLPCVLPLYLYGISLFNKTIFADCLYIDSSYSSSYVINPGKVQNNGKVVVAKDNEVKIYAMGRAFIDGTLQLSENSTFNLYCGDYAEIRDVYVPKGAKLIINAKHVSVGDCVDKHPEGIIEFISRDEQQQAKSRALRAPAKKLAVKGRTWWYRGQRRVIENIQEWGIRIGDEVTINDEVWNKVDLCLYTDEYKEGENPVLHKDTQTIAYIKDDGHTVCAMHDYEQSLIAAMDSYLFYGNEKPFYLYTFGDVSETGIYGLDEPYEIKEINEITNSGIKYRYFKAEIDSEQAFFLRPLTTYDYVEGIGHPELFMLMPSGGGDSNLIGFQEPELTYVTEGEDNHVIFEAAGGEKLWEMAGVESVVADPQTGAVQWFNMQGVAISQPDAPGLYIRRTASKSEKVLIR